MILDFETLFVDKGAFDAVPKVVDAGINGSPNNPNPGPGEPLVVFFIAHTALTGATGIQVISDDNPTPTTIIQEHNVVPPVGVTIEFRVPSIAGRYTTIALAGTPTDGEYSCGIVLEGNQTNA